MNDHNYLANNITDVVLPGRIKKLNSDGTLDQIIVNICYTIDNETDPDRSSLLYLRSITTMADVYSLNCYLPSAPELRYFNLMEGLQILKLTGNGPVGDYMKNINLIVPSSVKICQFEEIRFGQLIFNGCDRGNTADSQPIQLRCDNVCVQDKLVCLRRLTDQNDSHWRYTNNSISATNIIETSTEALGSLFYNYTPVSFGNDQASNTTLILHCIWNTGVPSMSVHRLINMTSIPNADLALHITASVIVG